MAADLESLKKQLSIEIRELESEIQKLELEQVRKETMKEEKQKLLKQLNGLHRETTTSVSIKGDGPKTITALGPHIYEYRGKQFSKAGQILDHFGVPHYFSEVNKGGDEAVRQIVRWAKRNSAQAREVTVILADGNRLSLYDAVNRL